MAIWSVDLDSADEFLAEFDEFLKLSLSEQLEILPK